MYVVGIRQYQTRTILPPECTSITHTIHEPYMYRAVAWCCLCVTVEIEVSRLSPGLVYTVLVRPPLSVQHLLFVCLHTWRVY